MNLKNTPLIALTCAALLGSAALSQANVIIQENFDYADGGLSGQNGGTGWGSNVWFDANSSVSRGVAVVAAVAYNQAQKRNFAATLGDSAGATATVWVRFDWGHSGEVAAGSGYGGPHVLYRDIGWWYGNFTHWQPLVV